MAVINESEPPILLTGTANSELARKVGLILGLNVDEPVSYFKGDEVRVRIKPNLRRKDVFIIQPTSPPKPNDYIMELLTMIDAARRASAGEITVVLPYYGYARQDRKEQPRVPITAALMANLIKVAGADRIVTLDLHAEQTEGCFGGPWENLYASYALIPAIQKMGLLDSVVIAPDRGDFPRAQAFAKRLGLGAKRVALVLKERDPGSGESRSDSMIGDVNNRDALITDDMISGSGTIIGATELAKINGARRIVAAVPHGLFFGDALERIEKSQIEKVLITDTINHRPEVRNFHKIDIVSIAPLLAETIRRIHVGEPLSDLIL